jgi:hypothetical protein
MGSQFKDLVLGAEFEDLFKGPAQPAPKTEDISALGEELVLNLTEQLALYESYVATAEEHRLALINKNVEGSHKANTISERLLTSLGTLEMARLVIMERFTDAFPGKKNDELHLIKCESLYALLSPDLAERLKTRRDALLKIVGQLRSVLAVNAALAENGSRIIQTTIGIMTSVVGRSRTERMNTYGANGSMRVAKVQVRNLINRSV